MQKMNPSVDDVKIILYQHFWELKLYLSFIGVLFRFLQRENIFIPELSFFSFTPAFYLFLISFSNTLKHRKTQQRETSW